MESEDEQILSEEDINKEDITPEPIPEVAIDTPEEASPEESNQATISVEDLTPKEKAIPTDDDVLDVEQLRKRGVAY